MEARSRRRAHLVQRMWFGLGQKPRKARSLRSQEEREEREERNQRSEGRARELDHASSSQEEHSNLFFLFIYSIWCFYGCNGRGEIKKRVFLVELCKQTKQNKAKQSKAKLANEHTKSATMIAPCGVASDIKDPFVDQVWFM
jgi:hypothetical protein